MNKRAIVIGAGPSLNEYEHLELIAESNFEGYILVTDKALQFALEKGITPDKFPNYYVISAEDRKNVNEMFSNPIVKRYSEKINLLYFWKPKEIYPIAREFGFNLQLYEGYEFCLFGNSGGIAWFVAWNFLHCNTVILVGMDHSWGSNSSKYGIGPESELGKEFYTTGKNPFTNKIWICTPSFWYYREVFLYIASINTQIKTINCSESGSLYSKFIDFEKLEDVL